MSRRRSFRFSRDPTVRRSDEFLILTTASGIVCGYAQSAYIYRWVGEKWTRIWQNEQNTYTEKDYAPQNLHAVLISHASSSNDSVVLTLGSYPWCSSNWQVVYYRLFPLGHDLESAPIVNGAEYA